MPSTTDDDTPTRPPPRSLSPAAEAFTDLQLCFLEFARDSGLAAARVDKMETADRADVLALFRRRGEALVKQLVDLFEKLPKA